MKGKYFLLILINSIIISCSTITDFDKTVEDHLKIAYVNNQDQPGIYVMNINGSGIKRLTDTYCSYYPSWSPDGTKIVYEKDQTKGIFIVDVETGFSSLLSENGKHPSWSPDGSMIAYLRYTNEENSIIITNTEGTPKEVLTTVHGWISRFEWSPDGSKIAFISDDRKWFFNIIDAYQGATPRTIETDMFDDISWSPDGSRIITSSITKSHCKLVTINTETMEIQDFKTNPYHFHHLFPVYSPDGGKIAFESFDTFPFAGLFLSDANRPNSKRLTIEEKNRRSFNPQWSPDGAYILYESGKQYDVYDCYSGFFEFTVINVDDGTYRRQKFNGSFPVWSPVIYK